MALNGTSPVRRLLAFLLAAALCGALAACGPTGGSDLTPTPEPTPTPAAALPTPTGEPTPTPVAATPFPSPTEGGESPSPAPTPETTPETTPELSPSPSATAGVATPRPSQPPAAETTPAPTAESSQEPSPLPCDVPDATSLAAAGLKAGQKMFTNGVTAEQFLAQVNDAIARWELIFSDTYGTSGPCDQFNWHTPLAGDLKGQTVLTQVKAEVLSALGSSNKDTWTDAYQNFDIQVYYSQLVDLLGQPLPWGSPNYRGPAPTATA